MHELARIATQGRPGPSSLKSLSTCKAPSTQLVKKLHWDSRSQKYRRRSCRTLLRPFFKAFLLSKSPLILAGHGVRVAGAVDLLQALSVTWRIPVVTTQIAKDLLPYADDNFVGHIGLRGDRAGNIALHEADLLLCIGTSLQQQTVGYDPKVLAPNSRKFVIDFEGSVSKKIYPSKFQNILTLTSLLFWRNSLNLRCPPEMPQSKMKSGYP